MTHDQPKQNRRALIIGIDKYPNLRPESQLEGCVRDAREVAALLETRFGFPAGQIELLLDEQATRQGILDALDALVGQVRENDAVVVHYSGHGSQRTALEESISRASAMEETFVAHDSGHEDPHPNRDVSGAELQERVAALTRKTPNVTLILDCCHSGTISTARTKRDDKPRPSRIRQVKADTRRPDPAQRRMRDVKDGPASFIRHVAIAACRDTECANELVLGDRSHGALTWNLLQELESLPDGACPTYRDVFEPVSSRVNEDFAQQQPQLEGARDRELFGLDELVPMRFLPIHRREADRVVLGGGAACGVSEGSVWTVHPPQVKSAAETLGRVEVISVLGMTATARILDEAEPGAIGRWCRAVEESAGGDSGLDSRRRRYRDALAIRNEHSSLRGKVDFNLGILKKGRWERLDDGAEVEEGDRISFGVVNRHAEPLYIYVLDFGLSGKVDQIYPAPGVSDPLAPGRTIEIGTFSENRLDLFVPDGAADGSEEFLKLFATTRETDLSSLFQAVRGDTREARASFSATRGGYDWITIERRFRVRRRPAGRAQGRVTRSGARSMS
ncbi:MAG: caspase family protein [Acidobacteriota bacterium]